MFIFSNFCSSLVWDQDIYLSNYGQYFLSGFTVALAWELPSQPTYPDWEQMGTSHAYPESFSSSKTRKDKNSSDPIQTMQSKNLFPSQESRLRDEEAVFKNNVRNYYEFLKNGYRNQFDKNFVKNGVKSTEMKFPHSPEYSASNHFDAFTKYMIGSYFEPWFDSKQRSFT